MLAARQAVRYPAPPGVASDAMRGFERSSRRAGEAARDAFDKASRGARGVGRAGGGFESLFALDQLASGVSRASRGTS